MDVWRASRAALGVAATLACVALAAGVSPRRSSSRPVTQYTTPTPASVLVAEAPATTAQPTATTAQPTAATAQPTTTMTARPVVAAGERHAPGGRVVGPGPGDVITAGPTPRPTPTTTVAYGDHPAQQIDLYLPAGPGPHPVLVWLHAGGWIAGDRDAVASVMFDQVATGWAVASAGYRLAPGVHFPEPLHDAKHAVRFLKAHGASVGIDPDVVVVAGGSAGGHLAALVAPTPGHYAPQRLDAAEQLVDATVAGLVSLVGPVDLEAVGNANRFGAAIVSALLDCPEPAGRGMRCDDLPLWASNPAIWARNAPDNGVALPPAYLAYGAHDTLVSPRENSDLLFAAWQSVAPGLAWYDLVEDQGHNLDIDGINASALGSFLDAVRSRRA